MAKKPKPELDDKEQSQRFVETAKSLDIDDSGKSFERALGVIKSSMQAEVPARSSLKRASSKSH